MAFLLICFHFAAQVFSETLPALPQDVLFDNWQVTWTSASEESTVTYTVRYSSFDSDLWKDVPTCKQINFTSCKVTSIKAEAEHGCVMLGVQAERRGLTSDLVRACSRQGTLCSPEVRLSARPGFFTIYLSRKNGIALEGDHIKHRIYFGKEGEHLEKYEDAVSSVSINNLKEGERYCAKVQYTYFDHPVGLSSCTQCEVIPQSRNKPNISWSFELDRKIPDVPRGGGDNQERPWPRRVYPLRDWELRVDARPEE
ncbi:interferon gamma receptor 2 isoform X8 [Syngnathus typhle]|uniref:interferon gamma receptor 2 isoform X8 n=1 Tax=Syngnathus typhle TaxID=161592 RepID=UPI002A6B66BC|nr:interferon gamma receptor 2 isoform X8 [Syngnathus typhle]